MQDLENKSLSYDSYYTKKTFFHFLCYKIMILLHLLYFISCSSMGLVHEYESKIKYESTYDTHILKISAENMLNDNINTWLLLQNVFAESHYNYTKFIEDKIFFDLLDNSHNTLVRLLCSILNLDLQKPLIKLILNLKLNKCKNLSNYLVSSVLTTYTIQNLIIVSSSERKLSDNKEYSIDFMKAALDENVYLLFINLIEENSRMCEIRSCVLEKSILFLSLQHCRDILQRYKDNLMSFSESFGLTDPNEAELYFDVPSFKTKFFKIINEVIGSFSDLETKRYFFLFNHKGFCQNRITNSEIVDLYISKHYKTFSQHLDFNDTDFDTNGIDISYLEGKVFDLYEEIKFEYFMGLLQYISCSFKKHIICVLNKESFELEIVNVTGPPIELILEFYKKENDITEEIEKNNQNYLQKYFVSIVENKEYRFLRQEGDVAVFSKCLLFKCSHMVGNELLSEFLIDLSERCYFCNTEIEVKGYFEIELFTSSKLSEST